jgi:hypothetical protein
MIDAHVVSGLEADLRSGRYLSGEIEVVLGHHGDDGISPRQGMIREQQHRLAIVRHLDRTSDQPLAL